MTIHLPGPDVRPAGAEHVKLIDGRHGVTGQTRAAIRKEENTAQQTKPTRISIKHRAHEYIPVSPGGTTAAHRMCAPIVHDLHDLHDLHDQNTLSGHDSALQRSGPTPGQAPAQKGLIMKIVVIGGSGLIGSKLVTKLREHGQETVAASPNTGVNILTGEGLADALANATVVIDVSNSPSFEDAAALEFFETSTRNLLAAEAAAGVGHHVALSVVGTERLQQSGYFRAKSAQEKLIENSAIPYSIVHATQFFEFVRSMADAATDGGTVRFAPVLFQPIAGDEVAQAVGKISVGSPLNGKVEVAGPEQFRMDEFFRSALATREDPRTVVTDPHASYFGAELGERTLLPGADAILGETRYSNWPGRTGSGK